VGQDLASTGCETQQAGSFIKTANFIRICLESCESMSFKRVPQKEQEKLKKKESGWQMNQLNKVNLNPYNSLYDPNMRHFFENKKVQTLLYRTGQIDRHGRVIDLEKNKSKLHILDREFERAEKIEDRRQKDEHEMRYRVQRKRFEELERVRKDEILHKLKHDRELSKEILSTMRSSTSNSVVSSKKGNKNTLTFGGNSSIASGSLEAITPFNREGFYLENSVAEGDEGAFH